jgi:transcriptional regulator with XRE-family HTH domain
MQTFGQILRRIRLANTPSQKAFAKRLGYSRKSVQEWETGVILPPDATVIKQICDALEANPEQRRELLNSAKDTHMKRFRERYPDDGAMAQ